ncbi:MAG: M28 family peptidase [Flavobacteriales bacterium]|nr:M28 family peptidase [Flavobacteriales bacterium]MCB9449577.1 M28 family peptidase [Flavobacteriales bacterium]
MKKFLLFGVCLFLTMGMLHGQTATNIYTTNPAAGDVLQGNYNPADYASGNVISNPEDIVQGLIQQINSDSLHNYMEALGSFGNRNSGSDTLSAVRGIGAARTWALAEMDQFSLANEDRLVVSFLQFDINICDITRHKNVLGVLPGTDPQAGVVIIEGHMDSRCEGLCDTACVAQGIDDNGSGSALVLELARVMSQYTFTKTIVFMLTIGEEQGLYGAEAMAKYCKDNGVNVVAVLNNDIVGGVMCGHTASAPMCPFDTPIDSMNLRLFSNGLHLSLPKQLARFSRLEYNEMARPHETVKMELHVMTGEDRSGRGGDHQPFRAQGYPSIRFCSANENGDANSSDSNYVDNQHSSRDVMGYDTNNDMIIDSFLVDFNYLRRNALVNANAAAMIAQGPVTPEKPVLQTLDGGGLVVTFADPNNYGKYRVACRYNSSVDWDTLVTFTSLSDTIWGLPNLKLQVDSGNPNNNWWISVASLDSLDIESLFTNESYKAVVDNTGIGDHEPYQEAAWELHQNRPNPFDEATTITVQVHRRIPYDHAEVRIVDMAGREVVRMPIILDREFNEVVFRHGLRNQGYLMYSLVVDGRTVDTKQMLFGF